MIGAGVAVLLEARRRCGLVAPNDEGVDQTVGSAVGNVLFGESLTPPVIGIVRQAEVATEVLTGEGARLRWIRLEHNRLLAGDEPVLPDAVPRLPGELRRDQVRVGPGRPRARQLEHLWTEGGEHPVLCRQRGRRGVEAIEVLRHHLNRLPVGTGLLDPVDQGPVADADAAQEAVAVLRDEPGMLACRFLGLVHPEVQDSRGHHRRPGGAQEILERVPQVAAYIRNP